MADGTRGVAVSVTGWSGASIDVTPSGYSTETWDYDTEVGADGLDVVSWSNLFVTWLRDAGRAWSGAVTFGDPAPVGSGPRMNVELTASVLTDFEPNATAESMTGLADALATRIWTGTGGATGSVAALPELVRWVGFVPVDGAASREGAWLGDHQAYQAKRPVLSFLFTVAQAAAWTEAMKVASSPRTAYVWHEAAGQFVQVNLGATRLFEPTNLDHYRVSVEALG